VGKPYAGELEALTHTYGWAQAADVAAIAAAIHACADRPLISVGSGGSLTSAYVAAYLHTLYSGKIARPMTPYELAASPIHLGDLCVLFLTAGGGNPDILGCFDAVAEREPRRLCLLCTRTGTMLAERAAAVSGVSFHEFALPTIKDGFLATNSLLATCVLLARAFRHDVPGHGSLPPRLEDLLHPAQSSEEFQSWLAQTCRPLWDRATLVVLHGHVTQAAAIDLESKFTEAALGQAQLADYRNFAHGRHHWLAKHGECSAVISLAAPEDLRVAEKTLSFLPEDIPVARFAVEAGVPGCLKAVALSIHIAGLAGRARGIDPGRPSVPGFGRKLYHLNGAYRGKADSGIPEREVVAITRKAGRGIATLTAQGQIAAWREAYAAFMDELLSASFRSIIFDYDGTLCESHERLSGPGEKVTEQLVSLLLAGIIVGVATGRGKSVRKDLCERIRDPDLRSRFLIGYHNGAEIGFLNDESQPPSMGHLDESLAAIGSALKDDPRLAGLVRIEAHRRQITLEFLTHSAAQNIWEIVQGTLSRHGSSDVAALRSGHSIDILASGVSKSHVVKEISTMIGASPCSSQVLCVGDRGCWPGNDFALLQEPCSLSVDEVSRDPGTCWNLASAKTRCTGALLEYFRSMRISDGALRIRF
jgi:hydroxymethylpyrimidine pyrophosphatase-like HAD family hydrolase